MPVLRRLVADPAAKRVWSGTFDATLASVHACPACRKRMLQVPLPDSLVLDVCKKCSLVWFDPSELEEMPERRAPPPVQEAPIAVRQRLAIEEVKQQIRRTREEGPDLGDLRHWPGLLGMPVEVGGAEIACRPWATWATALAVSAVSIAGFAQPGVVDALALVPDRVMDSPAGFTVVSCFFVHAGWWHLLGNLYFLLVFGDNVEDFLGRKRWLLLLGLATIGASLLQVLGDPRGSVPCVGASGGISGLIVFYALRLPKARLATYLSSRHSAGVWITFPAWGGLLVWLLLQAVLLWQQLSGYGSVAALAHLGGAAVGGIAFLVTRDRR